MEIALYALFGGICAQVGLVIGHLIFEYKDCQKEEKKEENTPRYIEQLSSKRGRPRMLQLY